jgi:serine/threonine protein kinase
MLPKEQTDLMHSRPFREILCLIPFNHPCILSLIGWNIRDKFLEIGTEWFEHGSLDKILKARRRNESIPSWFNATGIAIIIAGIALGMRHIHGRGLVHRDFKPGNILIDNDGRPRISDFGLCRNKESNMTPNTGTAAYLSPEALKDNIYGPALDVFAFGLVMFELIVGPQAFSGTEFQRANNIVYGKRPSIGAGIPQLSRDLITRCWDHNPSSRPDFQSIVDTLKGGQFQLLPGVESQKVLAYVTEIEAMELRCYRTPIYLPPLSDT